MCFETCINIVGQDLKGSTNEIKLYELNNHYSKWRIFTVFNKMKVAGQEWNIMNVLA